MRSIDFVRRIQRSNTPVFTTAQAAKVIDKSEKYASLFLARLCKAGEIKALERGKYYLTGTSVYSIASNVMYPSYISMLSAFRYHRITTQILVQMEVVSITRHLPVANVDGYLIKFIKFGPNRFFGFYRDREGGAFVAYIEKAIVDSLYMENIPFAYVEEAAESAERDGKLNHERLDIFTDRMRSATLKKRVDKLYRSIGKERNKH